MFRLFSGSHSLGWSVLLKLTLFLVSNSSCLFSNLLSPVPRITYASSNIVPSTQTTSALSFSQPQPFTSLVLLPAPPPSSTPPTTYHIIINSSFIPFSCVCLCFWVRKENSKHNHPVADCCTHSFKYIMKSNPTHLCLASQWMMALRHTGNRGHLYGISIYI